MDLRFHMLLKRQLDDHRRQAIEQIARGVPSWEMYNFYVGIVQGLDQAIDAAEETRKQMLES